MAVINQAIDANVVSYLSGRPASRKDALTESRVLHLIWPRTENFYFATDNTRQVNKMTQPLLNLKTTNVSGPIEEALTQLDGKGVKIQNAAEVRNYLLQYSDLLLVIPTICEKASTLLSPSTQFTLALYRDPEIKEEYLTLYARQVIYEGEILDKLHIVNVECESLLSGLAGVFLTTTDFRSPQ